MPNPNWSGIQSVLVTPFDDSGNIDFKRYSDLVEVNISNGADAVIVCGSTGEFYAMTMEERIELFKCTRIAAKSSVPVIAGVSDLLPANAIRLAQEAEKAGLDGILAMPPIYAVPDRREIIQYFKDLCEATQLPVMLYNSPKRAGVALDIGIVSELAALPTVVAIKDSSGDIIQVTELVRKLGDKISVFVGYETMIRPALAVGAVGVVAMAHQLSGSLVRRYFDACAANDTAMIDKLEPALFAIYSCFKQGSYYAGIKAVMNSLDQPVGKPRKPLLPFSDEQMSKVETRLSDKNVAALIASLDGPA